MAKHYPGLNGGNYADGFVYNYYNAAWAFIRGLHASGGQLGAKLQAAMPRTPSPGYEVSDKGIVKLDRTGRRSRTSIRCRSSRPGHIGTAVVGYVPNVDQSFGGLFKKTSPPPGRTQPACVKKKTAVAGQDQGGQERRHHQPGHQVGR